MESEEGSAADTKGTGERVEVRKRREERGGERLGI